MVGHSNLGFADAMREAEERRATSPSSASATKARPRSRQRVRQAHRATRARASRSPGPGSTNLLTGLYDAKVDRSPVLAISGQVPSKVRGRGAFQDLDLTAAFADVALYSQTVQRRLRPRRVDDAGVQARARRPGCRPTSCSPTRCRACRAGDAAPGRPERPAGRRRAIAPPGRVRSARALALLRGARRPGHHRRATAPAPACDEVVRTGRAARRADRSPRSRPRASCPTTIRSRAACSAAAARRSRSG